MSSLINNLLTSIVFFNTTILAMNGLFEDEATLDLFDQFNLIFTYIFICELGLKLVGLGPRFYLRDKMNIFDGSIVLLSIFEMIFFSGNKAVSAFRAVRIFRTFRVLRVTRLLRGLKFMQIIIEVVGKVINSFMYISMLLFLFIFIYSLLGM
jgi:hypothetical protein